MRPKRENVVDLEGVKIKAVNTDKNCILKNNCNCKNNCKIK